MKNALTISTQKNVATTGVLILLAAMNAVPQFANSINFASFQFMATDLNVALSSIQFTLSLFLITSSCLQLVFGPLSDRYGRKIIVIPGLLIFILGSGLSAMATSIDNLITGRIFQAVGASASLVVARATTRDYFEGKALSEATAVITMVFAASPGLAPLLGGYLQDTFGWESTFWASLVFGVLVLIPVFFFQESLPAELRTNQSQRVFENYLKLFSSARFNVYSILCAFIMAGLYVMFSGAPAIYIDSFGFSPTTYGFVMLFSVAGFIAGGLLVKQISAGRSPVYITTIGALSTVAGSLLLLTTVPWGLVNEILCTAALVLYGFGTGITASMGMAQSIEDFPDEAGTAAAMTGFLQILGATLGVFFLGLVLPFSKYAMVFVMFGASVSGLSLFLLTKATLRPLPKP